jgi:hypothetical protein
MPIRTGVAAAALATLTAPVFSRSASAEDASRCTTWDATYKLSGTLRITDTQAGAGNGTYRVGPGTLVLRFDAQDPARPARVELRSFELHQHFAVEPKAVFWSGKVVTDAMARATPDGDGVMARGTLTGDTLRWSGQVNGYRSDGSLECSGSLCGNFGAPPQGRSATHSAAHPVTFESLRFGGSGATFDMVGFSVVSRGASPRQTTLLQLKGRAASWVCVRAGDADQEHHATTRREDSDAGPAGDGEARSAGDQPR